jgi:hypothetical protein
VVAGLDAQTRGERLSLMGWNSAIYIPGRQQGDGEIVSPLDEGKLICIVRAKVEEVLS